MLKAEDAFYSRELVDGDDDLDAELARVLDVLREVLAALLESDEVLLRVRVVERLARRYVGSSTVHLQRAGRCDDDRRVGGQAADAALDVAELLHTHIGAETTLGEHVPDAIRRVTLLSTRKLERDTVGEDRGVAVGDVREGAGVDEDGGALFKSEE